MSNITVYLLHITEFSYVLTKFKMTMKKAFKGKDSLQQTNSFIAYISLSEIVVPFRTL